MNKFARVKELVCDDCGAKFFGLCGKYCESCRKKRKSKKRHTEIKICPICKQPSKMYAEQIICRTCNYKMEEKNRYERLTVQQAEERIRARKTGGKLEKIEKCPNFDGTSMTCVTCEPGSWKFKGCGQK